MKKLKSNVKWIMAALVAVIIGAAGITLTAAMVQGKLTHGSRHEEKAKYRSSIQVPDDKNEREEPEEVEGSEENEASEAGEANESKIGEKREEAEDKRREQRANA